MGLEPGDLDRLIVLQTAATVQGTSGEVTYDWDNATSTNVWAQWLPAGTREAWQARERLAAYVDGVFHIYDRATRPSPEANRILFEGRVFDVKPWIEIGRREGLQIPVVARGEAP